MLLRTLQTARAKIFRQQRPRANFRPTVEGVEERVLLSTLPRGFTQSVVARGLIEPTGLVPVPDGRIFVIQQTGQVRVIQNGHLQPQPLLSLTTDSGVERGLIGITIDPAFPKVPYIYVYYTVPGAPAHNRVSRFTVVGETLPYLAARCRSWTCPA
jgi:glucose/arabinose dehydrogenase